MVIDCVFQSVKQDVVSVCNKYPWSATCLKEGKAGTNQGGRVSEGIQ